MFYRRKLPHLQRDDKPHFLTFCTYHRWVLPESARSLALDCCVDDHNRKYELLAAVVMPDHVHLIFISLVDQERMAVWPLARITNAIKGASAHKINQHFHRKGHVWQTESFDHVIRSSDSLGQKIQYLLDKPVRRGLIAAWNGYPWTWHTPEWTERLRRFAPTDSRRRLSLRIL